MKSKNIKLIINGREIPNLSSYTYFDAKSFFKEPQRSTKGVIANLNGYSTFLTPRLKFEFKYMPIEAYRVLMKLIKEFNEFIVQAYDPVEDEYVTRRMYFKTKDFPDIYSKGLETLAMLNESFEMVGTNADIEKVSIVYNKNDGTGTTSGYVSTYGSIVTIGDYTSTTTSEDPKAWTRSGYKLVGWSTQSDSTGTGYATNMSIQITNDIVLYAIWESTNSSSSDSSSDDDTEDLTAYNVSIEAKASTLSEITGTPQYSVNGGDYVDITAGSMIVNAKTLKIKIYPIIDGGIYVLDSSRKNLKTISVSGDSNVDLTEYLAEGVIFQLWADD